MDVDPKSGMPRIEAARTAESKINEIQGKLAAEGERIESDLSSKKGQNLIALITSQLEARIEYLIKSDGEATALMKLLDGMGVKINYARGFAEKQVMRNLKRIK